MPKKETKSKQNPKSYSDLTSDVQNTIDQSVFEEQSISPNEYFTPKTSTTIDTTLLIDSADLKNGTSKYRSVERYTPDVETGLTGEQVQKRKQENLSNVASQKGGTSVASIFLKNIFTWFNILTFIVAAALLIVDPRNISKCAFLIIVLINLTIGIVQEIKSKRMVDKLKLVTAPTALVVRDGKLQTVAVEELVLDDIVHLEMGKQICADCELIRGDVEVNESMLTGESVPVKKKTGEELYSGSFISSGSCYARVIRVGDLNYVSRLTQKARKYTRPKSQLHAAVEMVIKLVSFVMIPVVILLITGGITKGFTPNDIARDVGGAVIGMIPSGMFLLTSIALAASVIKLGKRNTMVRDLYCIEMLARVDTLCLDKTGTITDGTMQVKEVFEPKEGGSSIPLPDIVGSMLSATEDNNQTAIALREYFGHSKALTPITVMPFSSQKKLSAVTFENAGTYMLGAPEFVMKDIDENAQKLVAKYAKDGYRVLMVAHSPTPIADDKLPVAKTAICFIAIEDHIRPEAVDTIKWFKENNVAVKVISGDNPITVSEVAARVGVENADKYISLDGLSNEQVRVAANRYTVFGRVTPEQKRILVKEMKNKGHTVAMTGDGVNDILALREADCSVAMASGSEAARNVSHLVLLDSNFSSMPEVVREGRRVINNIQNSSSLYLMKTFMSVCLALISIIFLYCGISQKIYFFDTTNLLPLEMCIIGLPSVFLALQPNDNLVEGNFLINMLKKCIPGGVALTIAALAMYLYKVLEWNTGIPVGDKETTITVIAVVFTGFEALCIICKPADRYRVWICVGTFAITLLLLTGITVLLGKMGLGDILGIYPLTDLHFAHITCIISVLFLNYFVITLITQALDSLKTKPKGDKK